MAHGSISWIYLVIVLFSRLICYDMIYILCKYIFSSKNIKKKELSLIQLQDFKTLHIPSAPLSSCIKSARFGTTWALGIFLPFFSAEQYHHVLKIQVLPLSNACTGCVSPTSSAALFGSSFHQSCKWNIEKLLGLDIVSTLGVKKITSCPLLFCAPVLGSQAFHLAEGAHLPVPLLVAIHHLPTPQPPLLASPMPFLLHLSLRHFPSSMAIPNFLPFLSFLPDHLSILAIPMVQMPSSQSPAAQKNVSANKSEQRTTAVLTLQNDDKMRNSYEH